MIFRTCLFTNPENEDLAEMSVMCHSEAVRIFTRQCQLYVYLCVYIYIYIYKYCISFDILYIYIQYILRMDIQTMRRQQLLPVCDF